MAGRSTSMKLRFRTAGLTILSRIRQCISESGIHKRPTPSLNQILYACLIKRAALMQAMRAMRYLIAVRNKKSRNLYRCLLKDQGGQSSLIKPSYPSKTPKKNQTTPTTLILTVSSHFSKFLKRIRNDKNRDREEDDILKQELPSHHAEC